MEKLSDKEIIMHALLMWKNYIETGNVTISAISAANMGKKNIIRPLTKAQYAFVDRINRLATKCLK